MEILDELIECEVTLIVPYIGGIVQVCLEVGIKRKLLKALYNLANSSSRFTPYFPALFNTHVRTLTFTDIGKQVKRR